MAFDTYTAPFDERSIRERKSGIALFRDLQEYPDGTQRLPNVPSLDQIRELDSGFVERKRRIESRMSKAALLLGEVNREFEKINGELDEEYPLRLNQIKIPVFDSIAKRVESTAVPRDLLDKNELEWFHETQQLLPGIADIPLPATIQMTDVRELGMRFDNEYVGKRASVTNLTLVKENGVYLFSKNTWRADRVDRPNFKPTTTTEHIVFDESLYLRVPFRATSNADGIEQPSPEVKDLKESSWYWVSQSLKDMINKYPVQQGVNKIQAAVEGIKLDTWHGQRDCLVRTSSNEVLRITIGYGELGNINQIEVKPGSYHDYEKAGLRQFFDRDKWVKPWGYIDAENMLLHETEQQILAQALESIETVRAIHEPQGHQA